MSKTIIVNAGPRKNWNTAQLLLSAQKGAEEGGAETEYVDLYDLSFTGCRSCLICKLKDKERCHCYWKDELAPVIDRILEADAVIIGSPIYFGQPTAEYRALYERLLFCVLSYDDYSSYMTHDVNVGIIYTMNASQEFYERSYAPVLAIQEQTFGMLKGRVEILPVFNTLQVNDYAKFAMGGFNAEAKQQHHDEHFDIDLQHAFDLGRALSKRD